MIRRIIEIDENKCSGCGACAKACHEGAIAMINGKARLLRDDYCDGLGDCLPTCPTNAISFVEREAAAYDEQAVAARLQQRQPAGCPGTRMHRFDSPRTAAPAASELPSRLSQWPCQIKLTAPSAPCFDDADLLIASDCSAFAYANMHNRFMAGKITLIGCPKLDSVDYSEKLSQIFALHPIRSITVVRMEVPCCGGLSLAVQKAIAASGRDIPCRVHTISLDGREMD